MRVTLNHDEAHALERQHGMPPEASLLLLAAYITPTSVRLDGHRTAFDGLLEFLGEVLSEGEASEEDAPLLLQVALKIDPTCGDWIVA